MSRGRKVALGCGGVLAAALLSCLGFAYANELLFFGPDFSAVTSIEADPSFDDAALLARAAELPSMHAYLDGGRFVHQPNGSFCGPTSVADLATSAGAPVTPEDALAGSGITTVFGILPGGITLEDVADLVRRNVPGAEVELVRPESPEALREIVARTAEPRVRVLVNFHRGPLFGRGGGHHSPVGGYLEPEDLAVVLDTNESYHGPWLVDVDRLFEAVHLRDASTGRSRGLIVATLPN